MTDRFLRLFAQACAHDSGPLLAHVSTIEAARDMDILRAVVQDPSLNFLGASYGSLLGATYAALFPTQVNRMVLDGAIDPQASSRASALHQAAGFETALDAFLADCVRSAPCPLGATVATAEQDIVDLVNRLDTHPLSTRSGRLLTQDEAITGMVAPLYDRRGWPYERKALKHALQGHGDLLLVLSDAYRSRDSHGHYVDNSGEAASAISCIDDSDRETLAQIQADRAAFLAASPIFGPVAMWADFGCIHWPVRSTLPTPDYRAQGSPPIVVVGTTRDPATPYQQAVNLAREIDNGVLLSRDGDGHTALGSGNPCIVMAIDSYLVDGIPPRDGTMC